MHRWMFGNLARLLQSATIRTGFGLVFLATALGAGAQAGQSAAKGEIVIGVSGSSRPFAFIDQDGKQAGFNYDLANIFCQKLKKPCRVEIVSFADVLSGVSKGSYDIVIANLLKTEEREKAMLFSDPIWRSTTSLIGRKDLPRVEAENVKVRYRICVIEKSRQWAYLDQLKGPADHILNFPRIAELFAGLQADKCDLGIIPTVSALQFLSGEYGHDFDYYGPPLTNPLLSGTVHIAVSKKVPNLVPQVNAIMDEIRQNGSYRGLIFRYFPFDIL